MSSIAIIATLGDILAFGFDLATVPSLKGNAVIATIVSWEEFRLGMIGMGFALLVWEIVPGVRWTCAYFARKRNDKETAEAERRAAAAIAERGEMTRTIEPVREFIDLMSKRSVLKNEHLSHWQQRETLSLRRVMTALFKRVN